MCGNALQRCSISKCVILAHVPLSPGTRLGPYEINALIGAGGMGEVYRARDTRLDRTVAIKVLPPHLTHDPERRQRFEREARAVAALNHPHICALYDIGQQGGVDFLVMEHLEGESLASRLARGPLSLEEALGYAGEVADALAAAHHQEVFHRDLKPGNIMLTRAGSKLLDFGLAKIGAGGQGSGVGEAAPTMTADLTQKGTLLGTMQYMAPEQLETKPTDARTDIFTFGAVLYEMITGRKAFQGESQASLIGAILHKDPPSMATLEPVTPAALDRLVKKCLAKDPEQRWQSARDLASELQWIAEGAATSPPPVARSAPSKAAWVVAAAAVIAAVALGVAYFRRPSVEQQTIRFTLSPPEKSNFQRFVVPSPDGRRLAFLTLAGGKDGLWIRPFDALAAQQVPIGSDYQKPFWSPDSRYVAYFMEGKLFKVAVGTGGPSLPETVCECRGIDGTWSRDGVIVLTPYWGEALARIEATGGQPASLTTLDASRQEHTHLWPRFLPDGRHVLFLAAGRDYRNNQIFAVSIDSKARKPVLAADSFVGYMPRGGQHGFLFYVRRRTLLAQPFNEKQLTVSGEPFAVAQDLEYIAPDALAVASVSEAGVLVYRTAAPRQVQLTWVDRTGKPLGPVGPPGDYGAYRISPDGKRIAVSRFDPQAGNYDIWQIELGRGITSRVTFDPSNEFDPIWSPDGNRIVYYSDRDGLFDLFHKAVSGSRKSEELLLGFMTDKDPDDWSPDGRYVLFSTYDPKVKGGSDLWALPMEGDRKPIPLVQGEFTEEDAAFSPDGKWIVFTSNESGKSEVYVQRFQPGASAPGERRQISDKGGIAPRWRRDGKELIYLTPDKKLMAVAITLTAAGIQSGTPQALFELPTLPRPQFETAYDLSADGQRFLIPVVAGDSAPSPLTVVLNWKPDR